MKNITIPKILFNIPIGAVCAIIASCSGASNNNIIKNTIDNLSGNAATSEDSISNLLSVTYKLPDTVKAYTQKDFLNNVRASVATAYQQGQNSPIWVKDGKLKPIASDLINVIKEVKYDGLLPEWYDIKALEEAINVSNSTSGKLSALQTVQYDTLFSNAFIGVYKDMLLGHLKSTKADSTWHAKNDSTFNGVTILKDVASQDKMPDMNEYRPKNPRYKLLLDEAKYLQSLREDSSFLNLRTHLTAENKTEANELATKFIENFEYNAFSDSNVTDGKIKTFQFKYNLGVTGTLNDKTIKALKTAPSQYQKKLFANMERLRWLPKESPDEYIWVTIPQMQYFYFKDGAVLIHNRSMIGKSSRQTPTILANMANVVFNPPWSVPPTILKKDILPGIQSNGGSYIYRKGLKAYDKSGKEVDASNINESNYRNYRYTQPPGANAALGAIKFNMPNPWNIYLHDTPHRGGFASDERMQSSGCVRVQDPKDFAQAILGEDKYPLEKIEEIIEKGKTQYVPVKQKLPVYIVYLTFAFDQNLSQIRYISDLYGKDANLIGKLYPTAEK